MNMDSGWLQRKTAAPQRVLRTTEEMVEESAGANSPTMRDREPEGGHEPEPHGQGGGEVDDHTDDRDENDDGDDDVQPRVMHWRTQRLRVRFNDSSSSSSDDENDDVEQANGDDSEDGDALDQLLRDNDSAAEDEEDVSNDDNDTRALRIELGLDDDDQWNRITQDPGSPGRFVFHRPPPLRRRGNEIAMHSAVGPGGTVVSYIQQRQAQEQNDDAQEIDLTALSSDDNNGDDDDDEVEIVGSTTPLLPMPIQPGRNRKRRRTNEGSGDAAIAPRAFDTQRAESTNISLENNETIERFKAALKCSVCLEVIDDMTSTICGHVYCAKCIRLAIRVTHKCPLCQRPLRPTDIHGLYF